MKHWIVWFCLTASLYAGGNDPDLSIHERGVQIDAGKMGKFILEVPKFMLPGDQALPPVFKAGKNKGEALYPNGVAFEMAIKGDEIVCSYDNLPKDGVGTFKFIMEIPLNYNQGGKFRLGEKEFRNFPAEVETEQFVVIGTDSDFALVDAKGNGLELHLKSNWFGLQDNRVFKTNSYSYQFLVDPKAVSGREFRIKVKSFKL